MSLLETKAYQAIERYLTENLNKRLNQAQTTLLSDLKNILNPDEISKIEKLAFDLPSPKFLIWHSTLPPKTHTRHQVQCQALISSFRRCTKVHEGNGFCTSHSRKICRSIADLKQRAEKLNDDFSHVSLQASKGRRNYQIPDDLDQYYLKVRQIKIDHNYYLVDESGVIYSLDEHVLILGKIKDNYLIWFN